MPGYSLVNNEDEAIAELTTPSTNPNTREPDASKALKERITQEATRMGFGSHNWDTVTAANKAKELASKVSLGWDGVDPEALSYAYEFAKMNPNVQKAIALKEAQKLNELNARTTFNTMDIQREELAKRGLEEEYSPTGTKSLKKIPDHITQEQAIGELPNATPGSSVVRVMGAKPWHTIVEPDQMENFRKKYPTSYIIKTSAAPEQDDSSAASKLVDWVKQKMGAEQPAEQTPATTNASPRILKMESKAPGFFTVEFVDPRDGAKKRKTYPEAKRQAVLEALK